MDLIPVSYYYCCLSVAVTTERVEWYQKVALAGADMSKVDSPFEDQSTPAKGLAKIFKKFGISSTTKPSGTAQEYALATGRTMVYYDPNSDKYFTNDGDAVEYDPVMMTRQVRRRH